MICGPGPCLIADDLKLAVILVASCGANARYLGWPWILAGQKRRYPLMAGITQLCELDSTVCVREMRQAPQTVLDQGAGTLQITSPIVVKCRGNLNDALQKRLLGLR